RRTGMWRSWRRRSCVVLGFAAVNRFHVECVTEHEGDALVLTEVGEPVPGEHALDSHNESFAKGLNGVQEGLRVGWQILLQARLAVVVEDVQEQCSCVQITAGIESVGLVVKLHGHGLRWRGAVVSFGVGRPEPASWLRRYTSAERSTLRPEQ